MLSRSISLIDSCSFNSPFKVFYVVTWAWRSSKETAAVALRLSGGLRIERPRGFVPKWRVAKGKGEDVAKLGGKCLLYNYAMVP